MGDAAIHPTWTSGLDVAQLSQQMPSRTAAVALIVALGAALGSVACAAPTLDSEHSGNASAGSGSRSSKKSPKSKVSKSDDLGDDDDESDTGSKTKSKSNGSSNSGAAAGSGAASGPPPTFDAVYTKLNPTCGSGGCHLSGASSAPVFFGADEASTYGIFKDQQFAASSPSPLEARGAHLGPAMTADQTAAVDAWVTADPGGP